MANLDDTRSRPGLRVGTNRVGQGSSGIEVQAPTTHDVPSYIALESTNAAGTTKTVYYIWPDTNGVLRYGTTLPGSSGFDQDTTGTAV